MLEDELHDMTRSFLSGGGPEPNRPKSVIRVLENLKKTVPEHARVIQEYIESLERELEIEDGDA